MRWKYQKFIHLICVDCQLIDLILLVANVSMLINSCIYFIFIGCCENFILQSIFVGSQWADLIFVAFWCVNFISVLAGLSEKGRLQLRRWCCQGPRGVVVPQMDFITCQRGSRIKRVGLKSPPPLLPTKRNIWEKGTGPCAGKAVTRIKIFVWYTHKICWWM